VIIVTDKKIPAGSWVQIETTILEAGKRAEHLPEETKKQPLMMWVKRFLEKDAFIGEQVSVTTIIGRKMEGKLMAENPPYRHTFGRAIPELLSVGSELRELIKKGGR